MRITHELAAHKQTVIKIQFDRQSPDADAPTIEIVYQIYFPENLSITDDTRVLIQRSVTRTDTRENIQLTDEENQVAITEAAEYASSLGISSF